MQWKVMGLETPLLPESWCWQALSWCILVSRSYSQVAAPISGHWHPGSLFATFLFIAAWPGEGKASHLPISLLQQQPLVGAGDFNLPISISQVSFLVTKHHTFILLRLIFHVSTSKRQVHLLFHLLFLSCK